MKRSGPHNRFKLENLEPRILLSADTAVASPCDLLDECESDLGTDLLPQIDEVALGDEDRLDQNSYQNQTTYDPSQSLDDIFAGLDENDDDLTVLSDDENDSESEYKDDLAGGFEDEIEGEDDHDHDHANGFEDEDEHEDENSSYGVSVITPHQKDQIVRGLKALSRLGGVLEKFDAIGATITPTIDLFVGEFIGLKEILDTRLAKPVYDYFNDAMDPPDTGGVLQTIEQISGDYGDLDITVDCLDGGVTPCGDVLQFDLKIDATRTGGVCAHCPAEDIEVNSLIKQDVAGLTVDPESTIDGKITPIENGLQDEQKIEAACTGEPCAENSVAIFSGDINKSHQFATATAGLKLDYSFGVDLENSDEFFVVVRQFDAALTIESHADDSDADQSFVSTATEDAGEKIEPDVQISVHFDDTITADGRITLEEIEAITPETVGEFVDLNAIDALLFQFYASAGPGINPPDGDRAAGYDPDGIEVSHVPLLDCTTDISGLKNSVLDTFAALVDAGETVVQSDDFDKPLPVIDLSINQLLSDHPGAGSKTVFDIHTAARDYFVLPEAFNLDLTDKLNLAIIGSLPEIGIPDFSLENVAHKTRLKNLVESEFETTLAPDWDVNLYLPEIWSFFNEDFRIDDFLPTFQLLLGLPYVPKMDEIRSDLKSYFGSCPTLKGLLNYIQNANQDPLYNEAQIRTTATGKDISAADNEDSLAVRVNENIGYVSEATGDLPGSSPGAPQRDDKFDARTESVFHGLDPPADAELNPAVLSPESTQSQENIREIVFIDSQVLDQDTLIDSILSKDPSTIKILIIDSEKDGIDQITDALSAYRNIEAIHIISHGRSGAIRLGNSLIDSAALTAKSSTLEMWGDSLDTGADFLIYGCSVAEGEAGEQFVQLFHRLTGADIAASDDATGSKDLDCDWDLESNVGLIESSPLLRTSIADRYPYLLKEIKVASANVNLNEPDPEGIGNTYIFETLWNNMTINVDGEHILNFASLQGPLTFTIDTGKIEIKDTDNNNLTVMLDDKKKVAEIINSNPEDKFIIKSFD